MHLRIPLVAVAVAAAVCAHTRPADAQGPRPQSAAAGNAVAFEVRVENVAKRALNLSDGGTADSPNSSGVWAVHTGPSPIFAVGEVEPGLGLKGLAEAGMAGAFAPNLRGLPGVKSAGAFETALGRALRGMSMKSADGGGANATRMLRLGQRFEFTITAQPGDKLSLAMMLSQSNDGLIATGPEGIPLFNAAGQPISGDYSALLALWDAGTEVNEPPGVGANQGLRQRAPHAGDPERRAVRPMSEAEFGAAWPAAPRILRVTITPKR